MSTKSSISRNISNELGITLKDSKLLLDKFLLILKKESKFKKVKLSAFGTFSKHITPKRIGRNPKTLESYIINPTKKLIFKPSVKIKETLNWLRLIL